MADRHFWYVAYNSFAKVYYADYASWEVMQEAALFVGEKHKYSCDRAGAAKYLEEMWVHPIAWFDDEAAAREYADKKNGKNPDSQKSKNKEASAAGPAISAGADAENMAHQWVDKELEKLKRTFETEYRRAADEMKRKLDTLMAEYDRKNKAWLQKLSSGEATRQDYEAWLDKMSKDKAFVSGMSNVLAYDAMQADKRAMELINNAVPVIYAENANIAAFGIDSVLGQDHSFDLYDQNTVRRLLSKPDSSMRIPRPAIKDRKDFRWNRQKFTSAITQSVLQGESVPDTAKRLADVLGMDSRAWMMSARTALTGAENAGRVDSYRRAEALGIRLEQQWMATLDERTRQSHRELDGQHVPVNEKFKVDGEEIEFPGDPSAPPELVCNCRCTLVAWFPDAQDEGPGRWTKLPKNMSYDDWKNRKKHGQNNTGKKQTTDDSAKKAPTPSAMRMEWDEYDSYMDNVNADAAIRMGKSQIAGMDDEGVRALSTYTGNAYHDINRSKRKGTRSYYEDTIKELDRVLEQARTTTPLNVVRGVDSTAPLEELLSRAGNEIAISHPETLVGQVMFDPAYLSTTVDPWTAEFFGGGGGTFFHLYVPEGANAVYVDSISRNSGEMELLFRAHQEIVITHAEYDVTSGGQPKWDIWAEVLVD